MAGAAEVATEKRFPSLNNEEIKKILIEKDSKNTRRSTDSSVHVHVSSFLFCGIQYCSCFVL